MKLQRTMKSHISALLITLAVFDILFLFCTFPVFAITAISTFVDHLNTCVYPDGKTKTKINSLNWKIVKAFS